MSFVSDGDSSLPDPSCGDRDIAIHQGRELVEGESSRMEELSAVVEQRSYNLRPRKDDSVTMQRRLEFIRQMEQRKQIRVNLKESEALKQEKIMKYLEGAPKRLMDIFNRLPKRREVDFENRTEIINSDAGEVMEMEKWRPYFESPDFGLLKTTLKGTTWAVEELALQAAPSVVGLQSFTDQHTDLFSCSGTIFESSGGYHKIVTVANLVKKCSGTDEVAEGLTINVYLNNRQTCRGLLLYHDFFYNICVIEIQYPILLPKVGFSSRIEAISFHEKSSRNVITLGREKDSHALVVTKGKIIPKNSSFDCEELLVSSSRISKEEVGGPLMNFDGDFIGLNYYHHKETPFIPSFIVLKCLQQLKLFRKVVRPCHGLRVRTIFAEGCDAFEKVHTNFRGTTGVIIEKIEEQSSAKACGLNEGVIINRINGVPFSNAAELGGKLLDIGTEYMSDYQRHGSDKMAISIEIGVRGCEHGRTIVADKPASGGLNRWPFPKPIIVREFMNGKKVVEKWYAMES